MLYHLQDGQYQAVNASSTFPTVPKEQLYQFFSECAQQGETAAKRNLRQWIRNHLRQS
jgi:hypothetical protein